MLLAVDIGNTNIVIGLVHRNDGTVDIRRRLATRSYRTADEWCMLLNQIIPPDQHSSVQGIIVSSVVPLLNDRMQEALSLLYGITPLFVSPNINLNISISSPNPDEIGADRIVNAAGAYAQYHSACIIIDLGTATTFDIINKHGEYLGGIILPGPELMRRALHTFTAQLPEVDIAPPPAIIGTNTITAMQSGLFNGLIGQIEYFIKHIKLETAPDARVIATGGLAASISTATKVIDTTDIDLTLFGLYTLYSLNT